MKWRPRVSLPPLKCAGRRQFKQYGHATIVASSTNMRWYTCPYCTLIHLKRIPNG